MFVYLLVCLLLCATVASEYFMKWIHHHTVTGKSLAQRIETQRESNTSVKFINKNETHNRPTDRRSLRQLLHRQWVVCRYLNSRTINALPRRLQLIWMCVRLCVGHACTTRKFNFPCRNFDTGRWYANQSLIQNTRKHFIFRLFV